MTTLDALILDTLRSAIVADLAELRAQMPAGQRGPSFDVAILRLADARRIVLSQDCYPESLSPAELRAYIRDRSCIYTTATIGG